MKHSVISWDCSYRNFFHLIDAMLAQDFDRGQFELVFVEQRTREHADAYNHRLGLKSLADRLDEVKERLNLKVFYLDDPPDAPYHLGRANNEAIRHAEGEIISVMDGDMLLPRDFLARLWRFHDQGAAVVNLERLMCQYPVGVRSFRQWREAVFDYDRCLKACGGPVRRRTTPKTAGNKGPLISARADLWDETGGYDPHCIWSTSASAPGGDVNRRLELAADSESLALPGVFAVHPWHPSGYARRARGVNDELVRSYLGLQRKLIHWAEEHERSHWRDRAAEADRLLAENRETVETVWRAERCVLGGRDTSELDRSTLPSRLGVLSSEHTGTWALPIRLALRCLARIMQGGS